jgi:hypothetical protein
VKGHRRHPLWIAYALHCVSGLALALFLPLQPMRRAFRPSWGRCSGGEWSSRGLEAHATIPCHGAVGILPTVGRSLRWLEAHATEGGGVRDR